MARDPLHNDFFRTLYHVSIIHTQSDLGALNKLVMQASIQKLGLSGIKRKMEVVDQLWSTIELFTDNLNIPFKRVRIYQDGLQGFYRTGPSRRRLKPFLIFFRWFRGLGSWEIQP